MPYARSIMCGTACQTVARSLLYVVALVAFSFALVGMAIGPAFTQETGPSKQGQSGSGASPKCSVASALARIESPLPRFAFRLAAGLPIKIVAIGSSSTAGAGASTPAGSYPKRLEFELNRHFPDHGLAIVNSGANGEEAP